MKILEQHWVAGVWPHRIENEDGTWDAILRSDRNEEVIRWRCGHRHDLWKEAEKCSRRKFLQQGVS